MLTENHEDEFIKEQIECFPKEYQELILKTTSDTVEKLIEQVYVAAESNNHHKMDILSNYIQDYLYKTHKLSRTNTEKLILIYDKYISVNVLDLNPVTKSFILLMKLVKRKQLKVKLDWKNYFKLFNFLFGKSKFELNISQLSGFLNKRDSLDYFFIKLSRFYEMSKEDYDLIKENILYYCYPYDHDASFEYGLRLIYYFLPSKYFEEDKDLQEKLLNIFLNMIDMSEYVVMIFAKFSKVQLKVNLNLLVESVFNKACLFVIEDYKTKILKMSKKLNRALSLRHNLTRVIISYLFNDNYKDLYGMALERFKMLINLIDGNLRENTTSACIRNNISFLSGFLAEIHKQLKKVNKNSHDQNKENISEKEALLESYNKKVVEICSLFENSVIKALFLNSDHSVKLIKKYAHINMNQVNERIIEVFNHFVFDDVHHMKNAIIKIPFFLKNFLSNFSNPKCTDLLCKINDTMLDHFNSINLQNNLYILSYFNQLFTYLPTFLEKPEYTNNKKFKAFVTRLEQNSLEIVKKYFSMYEMFSNHLNEMLINLFFYNLMLFLSEESIKTIENLLLDYIKDNLIIHKNDLKGLHIIMILINHRRPNTTINTSIFNHCFKFIMEEIEEEKQPENILFKPPTLFEKNKQINYKLNRSNEARIVSLLRVLLIIDLNSLTNDKISKDRFFYLLTCLLKSNEDTFQFKFSKLTHYYIKFILKEDVVIEAFMNAKNFPNKEVKRLHYITFPKKERLMKIIEYFNLFVKPYLESYTDQTVNFDAVYNQFRLENISLNSDVDEKEVQRKFKVENKVYRDSMNKLIKTLLLVSSAFNTDGVLLTQYLTKIDSLNDYDFEEKIIYEEINNCIRSVKDLNESIFDFVYKHKFGKAKEQLLKNYIYQEEIEAPDRHHISSNDLRKFIKNSKDLEKGEKSYIQFIRLVFVLKANNDFFHTLTTKNGYTQTKLQHLSKLIIKTQNQNLVSQAGSHIKIIFNKLDFKENKKLISLFFNCVFDDYFLRIKKIKNKEKPNQYLLNEQSKLNHMLEFFSKLITIYGYYVKDKYDLSMKLQEFLLFITELNLANIKNYLNHFYHYLWSLIFSSPKDLFLVHSVTKINKFYSLDHKTYIEQNPVNLRDSINKLRDTNEVRIKGKIHKLMNLKEDKHRFIYGILERNYEKLTSRKSNNILIEYNIRSMEIMEVVRYIDFSNQNELKLFNSYEEKIFNEIISNKTFVEKKIILYSLSLFTKIKHKISLDYLEVDLQGRLQEDKDYMLTIKNDRITSNSKLLVDKHINSTKSIPNQIVLNIFNNFDSLYVFVKTLFELKDLLNDENMQSANSFDYSSVFKSIASPKMYSTFLEIMYANEIIGSNLFEIQRAKFFYYIFSTNSFSNYEILLNVYEKISNEMGEKKTEISLCVISEMLAGIIRYLVKIGNYSNIPTILNFVFKFYTNNINKKIDLIILTFAYFFLNYCSVYDILEILKIENFVLKFPDSLILRFCNQLIKRFHQKVNVLFEKGYFSPEKILLSVISNDIQMIKNVDNLINFFRNYIYMYDIKINQNYTYTNEGFSLEALKKIRKIGDSFAIKEYNHAYVQIFKLSLHIFIKDPEAILEEISILSKMFIIDDDKLYSILQGIPDRLLGISQFPVEVNKILNNITPFFLKLSHIKS